LPDGFLSPAHHCSPVNHFRQHAWIRCFAACIALLLAGAAGVEGAPTDTADGRFLAGLRQRGLFELAEKHCEDRLADEGLDDTRRAELVIELSRTLAEHALNAPAAVAPPLWQRSTDVIEQFATHHARSPRLLLVRLQGALVLAAQSEAAVLAADDHADAAGNVAARDLLRQAIVRFDKLSGEIAIQLRRPSRSAVGAASLSTAELQSLQMHVQLELARTLRNQALSYPEGSADRINALTRGGEALSAVIRSGERSPLTWSAELEEIARQRLLGEYSAADRKLAELDKTQPPPAVSQKLRAERMRLALARGRVDDALAEAGTAANMPRGAEVDFARLETLLAAWSRATQRQQPAAAAEWQSRAVEQAQEIGRKYGANWMRRAESLLARAVAGSGGPQSAATLSFAAAGYYRGGQLDKALATFDEAARKARDTDQAKPAFNAAYSAATIEKERGNYRAAADRYRRLALDFESDERSAAAHLLAVFCAAQLAQASKPPKLDEYEKLLREHVTAWPQGATTSQAFSWLGRLAEQRGDWPAAIGFLLQVRPGDPQYAEAVAAIGRCYEAQLADLHARGQDGRRFADDALATLERIAGGGSARGTKPTGATRAATLAATRIWLTELPTGALPAERLLRGALESDRSAPDAWKTEARRWLVPALVMQSKGGQADQVVDQLPRSAAESLALLESLATVRRRHPDDAGRKLAEMELAVANELLERRQELDGDALRAVLRRRALTLAETGRLKEGLEELQSLAREFPRDGQTHEDMAELLMAGSAADVRAALAKWQEVAHKSRPGTPRWFRANFGLAETQLKLDQRAEARATIQSVAERFPELGGPAMKPRFERLAKDAGKGR